MKKPAHKTTTCPSTSTTPRSPLADAALANVRGGRGTRGDDLSLGGDDIWGLGGDDIWGLGGDDLWGRR